MQLIDPILFHANLMIFLYCELYSPGYASEKVLTIYRYVYVGRVTSPDSSCRDRMPFSTILAGLKDGP